MMVEHALIIKLLVYRLDYINFMVLSCIVSTQIMGRFSSAISIIVNSLVPRPNQPSTVIETILSIMSMLSLTTSIKCFAGINTRCRSAAAMILFLAQYRVADLVRPVWGVPGIPLTALVRHE